MGLLSQSVVLVGAHQPGQAAVPVIEPPGGAAVPVGPAHFLVHQVVFYPDGVPPVVRDGSQVPSLVVGKAGGVLYACGLFHMGLRCQPVRFVILPAHFPSVGQAHPQQVAIVVVFVRGDRHPAAAPFLVRALPGLCQAARGVVGIGIGLFRGVVDFPFFAYPAVRAVITVFHGRSGAVADTGAAVIAVVFIGDGVDRASLSCLHLVVPVADFPGHVAGQVVAVLGQLVVYRAILPGPYRLSGLCEPPHAVVAVQLPGPLLIRLPQQVAVGVYQLCDVPVQVIDVAFPHCPLRVGDPHKAPHLVILVAPPGSVVRCLIIL